MSSETARKTWRTAEPIHAFIYFLPEAAAAYEALGPIGPRTGYFASRSAPMGAVPAEDRIAVWAALAAIQAGINEGHAPALPRGIPRIGGGVSFTSPAYSTLSAIQRYCRFACLAAPNEPMSPVCMRQVLHLLDSPWCKESQADALAILREMDPRK